MALIALTYLFIEGGLFLSELRKTMPEVLYNANGLLNDADKAAVNINSTATVVHNAAQAQASYWPKELQETQKVTAAAKELIVRTNLSLNGGGSISGVLPQLTDAIRAGAMDVSSTSKALNGTIEQTQTILANLLVASKGAADTMSDPDIPATLKEVRLTSEHVAGTTANLDSTSHDIQQFVHRETAPVKGTWNVIKSFLVSFAGPMAQVATAAK